MAGTSGHATIVKGVLKADKITLVRDDRDLDTPIESLLVTDVAERLDCLNEEEELNRLWC